MAVLARWQSPATTSPSARRISSASLPAIGMLMSAFSARRPHMPSMPLHCCTSFTLAPVSLIRSRLFSPMFWAFRWQGVWYVTVLGHEAGELGVERGALGLVHLHQVLGGVVGVLGDQLGVGAADVVDVVLLQDVAARGLRHDDVVALAHRGGQRLRRSSRRPW